MVLMYFAFLMLGPVAAERGLSEEIHHPNAPFIAWALVIGAIALDYSLRSPRWWDVAWAAAAIGFLAVLGFGLANWRRRARLLGPIALETAGAGVRVSRRGESVLLPWDQLKYRELAGNVVIGTEAPRRWFIFPRHNQAALFTQDLLQEFGSHVPPVSDWPWARL